MGFLQTYAGMYLVQSVLHSLIAVFVVEISLLIWGIRRHATTYRYRLAVIFLPILMFPAYQAMNPARGSYYFRQYGAIFDSWRWLGLDVFGLPVFLVFFFMMLVATTAIVMSQELMPLMKRMRDRGDDISMSLRPDRDTVMLLEDLSRRFSLPLPDVRIIDDEHPVMLTRGIKDHHIAVSTGLVRRLGRDRLRCALAHEMAHIARLSNMTSIAVYLFKTVMFFNPVSMLTFRKIVQDDEIVCDEMTAAYIGDPACMAETLRAFYSDMAPEHHGSAEIRKALEEHSHNLLLKERIDHMEDIASGAPVINEEFNLRHFFLTSGVVAALSYFIV